MGLQSRASGRFPLVLVIGSLLVLGIALGLGGLRRWGGGGLLGAVSVSRANLPTGLDGGGVRADPRLFALSLDPAAQPRNAILMLGDGMGLGSIGTASYLLYGPAGGLAAEGAPVTGLVRTWASDTLVTGSPGGASAMATGWKTEKRAISQEPDGRARRTLFEAARERGLATGLITTAGLVDATPAAFVAHVDDRSRYGEILDQMLNSGTDLMIGGDWLLYPKVQAERHDFDRMRDVESLAPEGYAVARTPAALARSETPLLAVFPARPGSLSAHGPPLADSVRRALQLLHTSPGGFLLVVENEETDERAHARELAGVVEAVAELDDALRVVLDFAADRGDTLVLLTADHDTGGPGIVRGRLEKGRVEVRWLSADHTAQWVPLFAWGPGARRFSGVLDNSEIGRRLAALLHLEGLPDPIADRDPGAAAAVLPPQ
jgi:alkaline phosphatase